MRFQKVISLAKNLLEPLDIVSKKNGRNNKELGDKIIEIEYYIGKQKLLKSGIYSLNHKPQVDELEHFILKLIVNIIRRW